MIPGAFDYHRAKSLDEAIALLRQHGEEGRLLAGGHSLVPMMKLRLANPSHLIDLGAVDALRGIEEAGGTIRIGAMTTQAEVVASDLLAARLPILRETARQIADPQVRYCGTIGGIGGTALGPARPSRRAGDGKPDRKRPGARAAQRAHLIDRVRSAA